MDKVIVTFECPNCHVQKKLKKAPEMQSGKMKCPNCNTPIKLEFDITVEPQTATATIIQPLQQPSPRPKRPTEYGSTPYNHAPDTAWRSPKENNGKTVRFDNNTPPLTQTVFLDRLDKKGKRVVERYQIYEGNVTIGRQDPVVTSDIMFDRDPEMSRCSIQISVIPTFEEVILRLKVLKATNPVSVSNHTLVSGEDIALKFGDIIRLGHTLLTLSTK